MIDNILDYILADPDLGLDEVVDIISFHIQDVEPVKRKEIEEDLKHAFSS